MKVALSAMQNMAASYAAILRVNKLLLSAEDDQNYMNENMLKNIENSEIIIKNGNFSWDSQAAFDYFNPKKLNKKSENKASEKYDETPAPELTSIPQTLFDIN